ncbi:MAG: hypothetical protein A3K22_05895 [Deltaproteobacteria bacterium RBG_16_42_7]|nr:MAG: hypothetical protein A3K22_05895 [Deltaproteobacteria bacterium RBG_16_42_7]
MEVDATVTETEIPVVVAEEVMTDAAAVEGEEVNLEGPEDELTDIEKSKAGTPKGVQKKIDELTRKTKTAEEEREGARAEAEFWKSQATTAKPAEQPGIKVSPQSAKPVSEDFQEYSDYVEALTDWKIEQRDIVQAKKQGEAQYVDRMKQVISGFERKVVKALEALPDFETVARDLDMRRLYDAMPHVTDAILELEKGPEIAYYLGKNRSKAFELARMHPFQAALEIGRIEARLIVPISKKVSQALEPIKPVGGGANTTEAAPDAMSDTEFAKWRKSFTQKRR